MIRRPRRTTPSVVVALVLLAACVLVAVCCLQALTGHPPLVSWQQVADLGHRLHWRDPAVLAAAGIVTALGLALVIAAVLPGRPTVLPLRPLAPPEDGTGVPDEGITRPGLRNALRRPVLDADGVSRADLRLRRHRVRVRVDTPLGQPDERRDVHDRVTQEITESLDAIAVVDPPRPRVHVRTRLRS